MSFLVLLLAAALTPARAEILVNAEVNKTDVALDEQIVLSVTVSGSQASLPEPQLPALPNFSVYSSGRSQNLSFVNGQLSSAIVYTYVLVPRFVGKGVIGPIAVEHRGGKVVTQPIEIQVARPGGGPAPTPGARPQAGGEQPQGRRQGSAPDLFVTAELDKKGAFVNEPVILSVKFYTSVSLLGNPQYQPPRLAGFLAEDLPPERHGNTNLHGRTYYYSEIKTALFPAQAGRLTIGPASVRAQVQKDVAVDPFASDFFDRFFAGGLAGAETRDLRSEPLVLTAEALPESGKPAEFSGAVGEFAIAAAVDRAAVKAGEAITLNVIVSGTGNLKAISDPKMPALPDFRAYETVSSLNLDKRGDLVQGSKVFRTVLVPRVSGELRVPPVTFSYFDPKRRLYLTASSLPISIKAEAGEAQAAAPAAGGPALGPRGLTTVAEDIRYLKPSGSRSPLARALEAAGRGGPLNAAPFLALALVLGINQWEESGAADPTGRRQRQARRTAASRVREAARAEDPHRRAALLSEALSRYLADKLAQPPAGLTLKRALELLREGGAQAGSTEEARALWDELDLRRFAPPAAGAARDGGDLEPRLKTLLDQLEKELKA